ncbi:lysophospholipid transporter LplT [mine drainage metagenome]|uniref:Lysophospholipid transporter LplT n=1 Tax=mine drainage metagenome TaxID=410659 RepID=A0A1J5PW01_9ZZZZ
MIGLVIMAFAHVTHLYPAIALLVLVGACGGFYVVPLNALLQERGHETVGAGHAVAVQNFMENLAMLALLGMYGAMNKSALTVVQSATIFGGVVLAAIMLLAIFRLRNKPFGQDLVT